LTENGILISPTLCCASNFLGEKREKVVGATALKALHINGLLWVMGNA